MTRYTTSTRRNIRPGRFLSLVVATFAALWCASITTAQPADPCADAQCTAPENGFGTAWLPAGCDYSTGDAYFEITGGLPVGTSIQMIGTLTDYQNILHIPGSAMFGPDGQTQDFNAILQLQVSGTGKLAGFNRVLFVAVDVVTDTDDRVEFAAMQSFQAELRLLAGELLGDPDFDLLKFTAGRDNGLPSPGHVTLTDVGGGQYNVDSFFNVACRIDYDGAPGSILDDYAGSSTVVVTMRQGIDAHCPCPSDINFDGFVNVFDLLDLLADWGDCPQPCPPSCDSDINFDCAVNVFDLLQLLADWGNCFPV